jgi:anti-sigma regulatory factor (Ser/Thr protein kinase)
VDVHRHEAFPYQGRDQFASSCASVVREGLQHDERMIVLAAQDKLDDLRSALGPAADDVALVATDQHGRNPSRITTMLHSFQAAGDGRHSRGIQETALVGRPAAAQAEMVLSDHMLNDPSLHSWRLSVICLYDTAELDDDALLSVRQSHPVIRGTSTNPDYRPDFLAAALAAPLQAPPADARRVTVEVGQLARTRAFVRATASSYQLAPERIDDIVLAANEILTNSLRFGGGRAELTMFTDDDAVVCDVRDRGRITDPLAGRVTPLPGATSGRGMWLVNQVCDLVQVRSGERGTAVRMFIER